MDGSNRSIMVILENRRFFIRDPAAIAVGLPCAANGVADAPAKPSRDDLSGRHLGGACALHAPPKYTATLIFVVYIGRSPNNIMRVTLFPLFWAEGPIHFRRTV